MPRRPPLFTSNPAECGEATPNKIQHDFSMSFFSPQPLTLERRAGSEPKGISNPQTNLLNLCASPPINPVCPCANCFHMPNKSIAEERISFAQLFTPKFLPRDRDFFILFFFFSHLCSTLPLKSLKALYGRALCFKCRFHAAAPPVLACPAVTRPLSRRCAPIRTLMRTWPS